MATPITPTTELEAVNIMLATIGEAPVSTLNGLKTSDVSLALNTLVEVSRHVQTQGWSFNTERDYLLSVDAGTGYIPIPANAVRVDIDPLCYSGILPVVRGAKLYDRKNHTSVFTQPVKAKRMVLLLSFDDLPEAARRYILIKAARVFQDRIQGDQATHAYTQQEEMDAGRILRLDCAEVADLNFLRGSGVAETLYRGL